MDASKMGNFIADQRKLLGMTQADLGNKLMVTDKAVSKWERGLGFPDINTLESLAEALHVSVNELMRAEKNVTEVSNEEAVAEALRAGRLHAFCADVLSEEPPHKDNSLLNLPNSYITPHIAWATREARERLMFVCVENVAAFIKGRPINVVS